jgi:hypothetical protein
MNASETLNTCKSNVAVMRHGRRVSNTCLICPRVGDNIGNGDNPAYVPVNENSWKKDLSLWEEGAAD